MKTICLIFLFCILISNCQNTKTDSDEPLSLFNKTIALYGNIFLDSSQFPGSMGRMIIDTILIMANMYDDHHYQIINMNDKKLVKKFGRSGRGPGEYPMISQIVTQSWYYGNLKTIQNKRIYSYCIDSLLNFDYYMPVQINIEDTPYFIAATEIYPGKLIGLGMFEEGMYGVIQGKEFIGSYLEYPIKEQYKNIDKRLLGIVYQGFIQSHPDGEKFVAAFFDGGIIQFLDMKKEPMIFKEIITALPDLEPVSSGGGQSLAISRATQQGYSGLATTKDYVYAVYSGKTDKDSPYSAAMAAYGNHLLVFDWNGVPVINFTLDHAIISLFIDQDNQYAYGSNSMGDIVRFPLLMDSRLK